jgi:hypothetical protein
MTTVLRVPQSAQPLTPEQMASDLLTQAKGDAREVEPFAWAQARSAHERNTPPAEEFWVAVHRAVLDGKEDPPVPRRIFPRFDANGRVTTEVRHG